MKLTIERAALLRALGHVQSVVERRNTIPILSNVMLKAEKGKLSLAATDMDIEIVERVPAQVQREGATTVTMTTTEFSDYIRAEIAKWGRVVREGKITAQ